MAVEVAILGSLLVEVAVLGSLFVEVAVLVRLEAQVVEVAVFSFLLDTDISGLDTTGRFDPGFSTFSTGCGSLG